LAWRREETKKKERNKERKKERKKKMMSVGVLFGGLHLGFSGILGDSRGFLGYRMWPRLSDGGFPAMILHLAASLIKHIYAIPIFHFKK